MPTPALKTKIVKKRTKNFARFQSDRFKTVGASWRRPRGIDNRVRRRFSGARPMPKIGYGSNKLTKHVHPNGFKHFVVSNIRELECLLTQNRTYAAVIAHDVGAKKRKEILERAAQIDVRVVNANARVRTEEASV